MEGSKDADSDSCTEPHVGGRSSPAEKGLEIGFDADMERHPPRFPRWTRQEIIVLIEGKRLEESKGRKYRVIDGESTANVESKWSSISSYCKKHGVYREAVQCRKRWSTLSRDYKRIKEWEATNRNASFWVLRTDLRRENKLPGFFDPELYEVLERCFGGKRSDNFSVKVEPEAALDDSQAKADEGLFSDAEHSVHEDAVPESPEKQIVDSPSVTPGIQPDKTATPCSTAERGSPSHIQGKKRRLSSPEENGGRNARQQQILSVLERNGMALSAHIAAHNLNCELDRNQRAEQGKNLIGVLAKLADTLGRIADKLA
ncbi:Trihelix transcription factor [Nymphaea thermarum]|nr:Trihelix transcription factor [Nymphaea thermarum]